MASMIRQTCLKVQRHMLRRSPDIIVVWDQHIGIISDHRNKKGVPFVIHHASSIQANYEEDILETWGEIKGHYRID